MADVQTPAQNEVVAEVVEAPVEEKLETVILTTEFDTNGIKYGKPLQEDEEGALILTEVEVSHDIAVDLRRRQRDFDRIERERFQSRSFTVNGRTGNLDLKR